MVTQSEHLRTTCCPQGHAESEILQSDQEPSIIDVKHKASTHIPTGIVYEESPLGDSNANGCIERPKPSKDRFVQSKTTLNDTFVRRLVSTAQFLKWLVRHAAWTLTTLHIGRATVRQLINASETNHSINRSQRSGTKSPSSHTRMLDHCRNSLRTGWRVAGSVSTREREYTS